MNSRIVKLESWSVPPVMITSSYVKSIHKAREVMARQDTVRCRGVKVCSVDAGPDLLVLHLEDNNVLRIFCDSAWVGWEITGEVEKVGFQDACVWELEYDRLGENVRRSFQRKTLANRMQGRTLRMLTVLGKCLFVAFDHFQYMFDSRLCLSDSSYVLLYDEENE